MTLETIATAAERSHLRLLGGFHPSADDGAPEGCATLLLLGPDEPGFWPAFRASAEMRDGAPDPMDRWSRRVIGALARDLDATALFPFDGPPYLPFTAWARASGRAHLSPVGLLVHDAVGLFLSYRGALSLPRRIALPAPPPSPCLSCEARPCLTACPVSALGAEGYDVAACRAYLREPAGQDCMTQGCNVRRACPASAGCGRLPGQSHFHMRAFL